MKKLVVISFLALWTASCKKNSSNNNSNTPADTTPPVISLNGNTNDTVSLNTSYTNPGATANDNVDGNVSANVTVTGAVNKDLVGEYRLYYNVKDAAGNSAAQVTRYVYVANDADYLDGVYNAVANCGASSTSPSTTQVTASNTLNNQISFNIPGNYSGISPVMMVNASAINITPQSNGSSSISGSGTIASNKKSFTLTYTATSSSGTFGTWNCSTVYTKQ
jgi:hypothetical protein